jgi:hypothetical protein
MTNLDYRYENDTTFKALVDHFLYLIREQKSSFDEVRDAALFAQLRYELERPSPISYISPSLQAELEYRIKFKSE